MQVERDEHYVYAHIHDGITFYIGMGKNGRAFDLTDPSRGARWKEYAKVHPRFKIQILKKFSTREEALAYESEMIKKLQPDGNQHGVVRYLKPRLHTNMDASEMGKRGAAATNKILTTEKRRKAAKKGWKLRKERLGEGAIKSKVRK